MGVVRKIFRIRYSQKKNAFVAGHTKQSMTQEKRKEWFCCGIFPKKERTQIFEKRTKNVFGKGKVIGERGRGGGERSQANTIHYSCFFFSSFPPLFLGNTTPPFPSPHVKNNFQAAIILFLRLQGESKCCRPPALFLLHFSAAVF